MRKRLEVIYPLSIIACFIYATDTAPVPNNMLARTTGPASKILPTIPVALLFIIEKLDNHVMGIKRNL